MDQATLQQLRVAPLFSGLSDAQSRCIPPGEVIEAPAGTVLATEGERTGWFHVNLAGEVRVTRIYDHQEILMGVGKPGHHMGEIPLLLDIPWQGTARVSKAARLFRLSGGQFLADVGRLSCGRPGDLPHGGEPAAEHGRLLAAARKARFPRHHGGGPGP